MLEHQNEHVVRDFVKFHNSQSQNQRFPTSFLTNRGLRRFSSPVTKCHACHGICTLSPLRATLTMRLAKNTQHDTSKVLCLQNDSGGGQSACACHEIRNASSENKAKALRLPHKPTFDTSCNMLECHEVPRLPRETTLREAGKFQKGHLLQNFPWTRPYGRGRSQTVADGWERLR